MFNDFSFLIPDFNAFESAFVIAASRYGLR